MSGKLFADSSGLIQDQARILFEYYRSAAETIVQQEESIEAEISRLTGDKDAYERSMSSFWQRLILLLTFKLGKTKRQVEAIRVMIAEQQKAHSNIFRDYKVSKMGVGYVPIATEFEYDGKSFLVDFTSSVPERDVVLKLSRQNALLIDTINELSKLTEEAPFVETSEEVEEIDTERYTTSMQKMNQYDYFGKLERSLRTIAFCMNDLDETSVSLPLVTRDNNYIDFIREHATSEIPKDVQEISIYNGEQYDDRIKKFQELNRLKDSLSDKTMKFEDVLKQLMTSMASAVQAVSSLKMASTEKLVFESNRLLFKLMKAPYNHYSPVLEASEIERIRLENFNYSEAVQDYMPFHLRDSSRVKYNLLTDAWTAEDGSTTSYPFGIHQIHEEIVAPIVQNLMNETRIERLKIYNHIKDQKISYLNKWHQDTEDFYGRNRAESADLINLMRGTLKDYIAAYNTLTSLRNTEESMNSSGGSLDSTVVEATDASADVLVAYETQSKDFQEVQLEFEAYMERLKQEIDERAAEFEYIEYYDGLLRDGLSHEVAVAASDMHAMDGRRKPLILINPHFAKNAELPPLPQTESILDEHAVINLPAAARRALRDLDYEGSVNVGMPPPVPQR